MKVLGHFRRHVCVCVVVVIFSSGGNFLAQTTFCSFLVGWWWFPVLCSLAHCMFLKLAISAANISGNCFWLKASHRCQTTQNALFCNTVIFVCGENAGFSCLSLQWHKNHSFTNQNYFTFALKHAYM